MGKMDWTCEIEISTPTNNATKTEYTVTCYFNANGWHYDLGAHVNAEVGMKVGSGSWSWKKVATNKSFDTRGRVKMGSYTFSVSKTHSSQNIQLRGWVDNNSSYATGEHYSDISKKTVSKKTHYTITYKPNGGSGGPSTGTKWYNEAYTVSSSKPTKSNHSFKHWLINTGYTVNAGGTITAGSNNNYTLTAQWTPNTYSVEYYANKPSGAQNSVTNMPSNQTKTYGVNLTLTNKKPALASENNGKITYTFLGWGTSASASSASYQPGGTYSANAAIKLYALWRKNVQEEVTTNNPPTVRLSSVYRCDSNGNKAENGEFVRVSGDWSVDSASGNNKLTLLEVWWNTTDQLNRDGILSYCEIIADTNQASGTFDIFPLRLNVPTTQSHTQIETESSGGSQNSTSTTTTYYNIHARYAVGETPALTYIYTLSSTSTDYQTFQDLGTGDQNLYANLIAPYTTNSEDEFYIQIAAKNGNTTGDTYARSNYIILPSIAYIIDVRPEGKGIAFGGVAKNDGFMEVNYKVRFRDAPVNKWTGVYFMQYYQTGPQQAFIPDLHFDDLMLGIELLWSRYSSGNVLIADSTTNSTTSTNAGKTTTFISKPSLLLNDVYQGTTHTGNVAAIPYEIILPGGAIKKVRIKDITSGDTQGIKVESASNTANTTPYWVLCAVNVL